jgi:hypothetical protein
MPNPEFKPDPARSEQIAKTMLQISSASDVTLIQELVVEYLKKGPKVAERKLIAHISEHFMHVFPAVMNDSRAAAALGRLNVALEANQPMYQTTLMEAKGTGDKLGGEGQISGKVPPSAVPWTAIAVGAAGAAIAGYYVLEAIAAYCGDVHPAKGQSAEVHC